MHKKLLTVAGNKVKSCFKKTFRVEQKLEATFYTYDSVSPKDIKAGQPEIKLHYSWGSCGGKENSEENNDAN